MPLGRRQWLARALAGGAALVGGGRTARAAQFKDPSPPAAAAEPASRPAAAPPAKRPLALTDFQPQSMLHVAETSVPRARFPVIDIHTHLGWRAKSQGGVSIGEEMRFLSTPPELLAVMDRRNIQTMVNLTGGVGKGLLDSIRQYESAAPGRFVTFTEPSFYRVQEPGFAKWQAEEAARAKSAGARGVKVLKTLGLFLREPLGTGKLVKVDDARFDPLWEACGQLGLPVAIHVADPEAFFLPTDRFNERYEELSNHPDWSFYDRDFPKNRELLEARNRVLERHPKTNFIVLHVGNDAENLAYVGECMDRYPNMAVEIGARIGELGRQPRTSRKFFDKYQDRILFGTDAVPHGTETPQQVFGDELYQIYYRFLETDDEYFDYAPAPVPPQGRWRIYGLGLPESVLKKVYHDNAARLVGLTP
jgi:predicted TIM-barrel fold metal-dependent hydrolase